MLKGQIHIGRVRSNRDEDYISIEVQDELSRTTFIEITMTLEDFAKAITNSMQDCEFELRAKYVGMEREYKTEMVTYDSSGYSVTDEQARQALQSYETDGWKGSVYDFKNHKNWQSQPDHTYRIKVGFVRYVPKKEE